MPAADEPIYTLPPYIPQEVSVALSETVDWSLAVNKIPDLHVAGHTGKGVLVAVLDTGVSLQHPDLAGAIYDHRDFTGEGVEDRVGHGTHTAGTIAARANDIGVLGVAPECKLLIGKCLTNSGGSDRWIGQAIRWAADRGAMIISMSLGSPQPGPELMQAIAYGVSRGCLFVVAAGNDGRSNSVNWPAKSRNVVAVSAYGEDMRLAPFSSRGPEVDICGPGVNILSTYKSGGYAKLSGTSMATPFCAGVAALLLEAHAAAGGGATPIDDVDDLIAHFKRGATDAGNPGLDDDYGWGLLNPTEILAGEVIVLPPPPTPPVDPGEPLPPAKPGIEFELGFGLVAHVPALATDLFTAGIALKPGATIDSNIDAAALLRKLEEAARLSKDVEDAN